ncbi:hypothetical protein ACHAQA_006911 [Verticillium albo-atrum]
MSPEAIQLLLNSIYPGVAVISAEQLPSGRSYNNRIYLIKVQHGGLGDSPDRISLSLDVQDLVLKLNGRFFGADKIQNEVACLRLMNIHCPDVPAPQVRAWSDDGKYFTKVSHDEDSGDSGKAPNLGPGEHAAGWIIMSRLAGESLSLGNWDEAAMKDVARQLALIVATWRQSMPAIGHCGNLLFCEEPDADLSLTRARKTEGEALPAVMARGNLSVPGSAAHTNPIASIHGYHKLRLDAVLRELESKDAYIPNRHLARIIRDFAAETLPRLNLAHKPIQSDADEFVFTHLDISPRNVLVSGKPPKITGIVDFEFSGFFPASEEFVQDELNNRKDWPGEVYAAYLASLEELGVDTPVSGINEEPWKSLICLARVTDHVAPWWLPGDLTGESLAAALKEAESMVRGGIKELEDCSVQQ